MSTVLVELNKAANNGDDKHIHRFAHQVMQEFSGELIGVELGSAYGGNVEYISKLWGKRGKYYGYDTFEGHPKQLAQPGEDFPRDCMDYWYKDDVLGRANLTYDYQRGVLDKLGLRNAFLVKGIVTEHSCDDIEKIHFAFLDMDLPVSMKSGYAAVKDKIVKGGYLLLHDVTQPDHIAGLYQLFHEEILPSDLWEEIKVDSQFLAVLRRL